MKIFQFTFYSVLVVIFGQTPLLSQNLETSDFWEIVENKVINPYKGMPNKIEDVNASISSLSVNNKGIFVITFGGKSIADARGATYISNDFGKSWEYRPYLLSFDNMDFPSTCISSSGDLFVTERLNTYNGSTKDTFHLISTDGKKWDVVKQADLLKRNFYGHNYNSRIINKKGLGYPETTLVIAKNGTLSDYINEDPSKMRRFFYPDGSVRVEKNPDKFRYQIETGTYIKDNTINNSFQAYSINEIYVTCDGKYFAITSGNDYLFSDDDNIYKRTNSVPFDHIKHSPSSMLFSTMSIPGSRDQKLSFYNQNGEWEDAGIYSGGNIFYNPKTKRFYQYKNTYFYNNMGSQRYFLQSKKTYEYDCYSAIGSSDSKQEPEENDKAYRIVFYAYGPTNPRPKSDKDLTLETSPTGHIYVGFAQSNVVEIVKGLSPKDGILNMGKVDESTDESYLLGYHTHCFTVEVSKQQYIDALKLTKSYYFSPISDCVSYADDVADLLGLITPKTTDAVLLPFSYLEFLKNNNKGIGAGSELCNIEPKSKLNENKNKKLEVQASTGMLNTKFGTVKTLQGSNLNIRSSPSDKAEVIGKAPNGEIVTILAEDVKIVTVNGEKGKWLKIEYSGVIGWVWSNYIKNN